MVGYSGLVLVLALSTDGQLLISGNVDRTVGLWDTRSGKLRLTLTGHTGPVWSVALSADSRLVASAGADGTVKLCEASTRECLRTLQSDRRYERLDITGLTGVTPAQRVALLALGAVDHQDPAGCSRGRPRRPHGQHHPPSQGLAQPRSAQEMTPLEAALSGVIGAIAADNATRPWRGPALRCWSGGSRR